MAATTNKKTTAKKTGAATASTSGQRVRKIPRYSSFRLAKRLKPLAAKPVPSSLRLFGRSLRFIRRHWWFFLGVTIVYAVLNLMLVRGLSGGLNVAELKGSVEELFDGQFGELTTGLALFSVMLTSGGTTTSEAAGAYQSFLVLIISLALVWGIRQLQAGIKITVRDAFYKGLYPLVPFVLILIVIGLQLVPLIIGNTVYSIVIDNGLAVTAIEKLLWGMVFFLLAILSLYMISSSIFALYIVMLPDMTPMVALRSARQLVLHRRLIVMRRIVLLPLILLVLSAIIIVPLIIFAAGLAEWGFFGLTMAGLMLIHTYMYNLYRSLL